MHIKICGIRTLAGAVAAAEAGADMLGFNFYPASPRYVEPEAAIRIICDTHDRGLAVQSVGVFVNATAGNVAAIADHCALDMVQLSGDEPPRTLRALRLLGIRAFKALRPECADDVEDMVARYPAPRGEPAWLIDGHRPGLYGGTGLAGDWSLAAALAARAPILLAGGLNPDNVAEAIRQVHPWGVDVASGVESAPGVKDTPRVRAFVATAQRAGSLVEQRNL